jgi:hypothetical protein
MESVLDIRFTKLIFFDKVFNKLTYPKQFPLIARLGMSFIQNFIWWFIMMNCLLNNNVSAAKQPFLTEWSIIDVDVN